MKRTQRIYKYGPIPSYLDNPLEVPGEIKYTEIQNGRIYVWSLVYFSDGNQHISLPPAKLVFYPTGYDFIGNYIGTVGENNNTFMWHIVDISGVVS